MSQESKRGSLVPGISLILVSLSISVMPGDWIEGRFGFEPDGGNGVIEWLLVLLPLGLGVALLVRAFILRGYLEKARNVGR
jgi:hypothetical protein